MADALFARHPLCTCGPVTFGGETKGLVTVEGCRMHAREVYGIDPHPVMNAADVTALVARFRERIGAGAGVSDA
jgi:hypothetical protein